jgi:hypothetical protein
LTKKSIPKLYQNIEKVIETNQKLQNNIEKKLEKKHQISIEKLKKSQNDIIKICEQNQHELILKLIQKSKLQQKKIQQILQQDDELSRKIMIQKQFYAFGNDDENDQKQHQKLYDMVDDDYDDNECVSTQKQDDHPWEVIEQSNRDG